MINLALILAGGRGERLRPLTDGIPKPLLQVGGVPIMERTIKRLAACGIESIAIAVNYRAEQIMDYFGDGERFGVRIMYLQEDRPLGTAGILSELPEPERLETPLLIHNGDIVTDLDYQAIGAFHRFHRSMLTIATVTTEARSSFGVLQLDGLNITGIREKAALSVPCAAGIYVLDPLALKFLPPAPFGMPDLAAQLLAFGLPVLSFPVRTGWRDIATEADLIAAQADMVAANVV